ncbi:phosphoribosylanthranilate isomerase [Nocardia alni]|uniref:phosphoribosylanthranilate isomerase n=1 Tax=Nocardia alni TaxID=2815723 RepID=UPI001C214BE7|nr:phosphoribosylanthranilate isomerase [Nocardia alni]
MGERFVKICGLRTERDVETAVAAGADAIGFVLAANSPRTVDAQTAHGLAELVPEHVLTVGVFRGQSVARVLELTERSGIRAVQLHGDEGPDYYRGLRSPGRTLIRAVAAGRTPPHLGEYGEDLLLLDAPEPGSGKPWNWASPDFVTPRGRWLLAGGLHPGNVRAALEATGAWGVDVSSGVESERGVKSPDLIRAFLAAARGGRPTE